MSSPLKTNTETIQNLINQINALPDASEQPTPVISVNSSNGLITATAGTKTSTHQLTTQAAKTITPSTSSQTAVASGVYTTGAVTVAGDANLKAENIAEGVSIFGVTGSHSGGSGGASDISVEFEYELTEEMYEPGANLYTFIPKTNFNINDCVVFNLKLEIRGKAGTPNALDHFYYSIYFAKFSTLDDIQSFNSYSETDMVTGRWYIENNNIMLLGTFDIGDNHTLEITGIGILI